jgi:RND family efflux transporter MFP subunit
MKKFILIAVVLLTVLTGWFLKKGRGEKNAEDAEIETQVVELRERIVEEVRVTGEVAPALATEVKSEISGMIERLYVENGQTVTNGQVLLELDRSELLSQQEELERTIASYRLRAEQARRDFERQEQLFGKDFVTRKEFEDARTAKELADNELEVQDARLQTLREKLAKATIRAPHDGQVLECDLSERQVIVGANSFSQGSLLMKVADLGKLLIESDVNEVDVTRLTPGMPARISFDSVPDLALEGTVETITPSARRRDNVRVFPVEITCASDDPRIRPGISADIKLELSSVQSALGVNVSAVFSSNQTYYVFLKQGDGFVQREVETGINDTDFVQITSGLAEGDEVAAIRPPGFRGEDERDGRTNRK